MPAHLQTLIREVKDQVASISAEAFSKQTDGVVTQPAHAQTIDPDNPLFRLANAHDDLKRIADQSGSDRAELKSALDRLEGILGTSEAYFP